MNDDTRLALGSSPVPSIVLLRLEAGQPDDPIKCSSMSASLDNDILYETLSYCWGDTKPDKSITKDGSRKFVTESLFEALRRLRLPDMDRTIWIDQLCIDQDNAREKSQQVSIMQQIYRRSDRGIIWIGELPTEGDQCGFSTEDVEAAFDNLTLLDPQNSRPGDIGTLSHEDRERMGKAILAMMGSPLATWKGAHWWDRIWTVQEAQLPEESILQWGHLTVSFDLLKRISKKMTQSAEYCEEWSQTFDLGHLLNHFCTPLANLQIRESPIGTFFRWRRRETKEPKDKIFGLMGLFDKPPFPSIPFCDYSLTVVELYKRVTLDLIREHRGLLPLVGRHGEPHTTLGLPSWAVDWMRPEGQTERTHEYFTNCRRWDRFHCDGEKYIEPIPRENNGLLLQGRGVDRIAILAPGQSIDHGNISETEWNDQARQIGRRFKDVFKAWLDSQPPDISYIAGDNVDPWDAFHRTGICDLVLVGNYRDYRATPEDVAAVEKQLNGENTHVFHSLRDAMMNQSFFITQNGYIGIGPPDARVGDEVWALLCGNLPHVLRRNSHVAGGAGGYVHVGDAYVHGIMDGEMFKDPGHETVEEVALY